MPRSHSQIDTLFLPGRGPRWWPLAETVRAGRNPRAWRIAALWSVAVALSIVAGVANVRLGWNAIEVTIAGLPFDLTLYPPFIVSVLLVLWLGPAWGALPIYLANLAGEEFVVLMPHTSRTEIGEVAERVRSAVAGEPLAAGGGSGGLAPTISVGAAAAERPPFDPVALVQAADEACYEAKRLGRNRVVVAES